MSDPIATALVDEIGLSRGELGGQHELVVAESVRFRGY